MKKQEEAISEATRKLRETQNTLNQLNKQIDEMNASIAKLEQQKAAQERSLAAQLDAAFRQGEHTGIQLILSGEESQRGQRLQAYFGYLNQARQETIAQSVKTGREQMANVNKIVRRRQLALFIALVLGIGAGGAGTWMVSEMNLKKAPPAKAPKGEPAPDMTGVVNQSFDNKVQRSAIAEAQRLNKETQAEIKKLRTEMGIIGRDLKGSQERIRELEDENKLLQTQIEAGKNFDSLSAEPLPGALPNSLNRSVPSAPPPFGRLFVFYSSTLLPAQASLYRFQSRYAGGWHRQNGYICQTRPSLPAPPVYY